jgi:hypothetical protein
LLSALFCLLAALRLLISTPSIRYGKNLSPRALRNWEFMVKDYLRHAAQLRMVASSLLAPFLQMFSRQSYCDDA